MNRFLMIEDDEEALELARFAEKHKLTDISERYSEVIDRGLDRLIIR